MTNCLQATHFKSENNLPGVSNILRMFEKDYHTNAKFHYILMENRSELFPCPVVLYNTSGSSTAYKICTCLFLVRAYPCGINL